MNLRNLAPILVFLMVPAVLGADEVSEFERGFALRIEGKHRKGRFAF